MSYASLLVSKFGTSRVWLYEFTRDGTTTRLVSSPSNYTDPDGVTWTASPVTHTGIRITTVVGRAETELVFPQSNTFARTYLTDLSYGENTLTIYHEFKDQSPTARVTKFRGRVIGTKPAYTRLLLIAENNFTETRRKGLSAVLQRPCRHALYHSKDGYGCGVTLASYQNTVTATAFSSNVLTVDAISEADGYYSGGIVTYNGANQFITNHTGTSLTLLGPVAGLSDAIDASSPTGVNVSIAPGCDLTRATCNSRFNNLANFGGFPFMSDSPFDGRTLF